MRNRSLVVLTLGVAAIAAAAGCGGDETRERALVESETAGLHVRDAAEPGGDHWRSPDIKIDAAPYADAPSTSEAFESFDDEAFTEGGNRAYVQVSNRGSKLAESVEVTLYAGPAATMLPRLDDERSGWVRLETAVLDQIAPGRAGVAQFTLPRFERPHQCLVAVVGSLSDHERPADELVAGSDQAIARNMDFATGPSSHVLVVRNPTSTTARAELSLDAPADMNASLEGSESVIELGPGEQSKVMLSVSPEPGTSGEVTVVQRLETSEGTQLRGGVTYVLRPDR